MEQKELYINKKKLYLIRFKVITTIKMLIRDAAASIHAQMIIHKLN